MTDHRLALPTPPQIPPPWRFPFVAVLAPVIVSVVLWLVTGSLFALVFAALGPVTAVASVADQWWGGRRMLRREAVRFERDLRTARSEVERIHRRERAALLDATPDGPTIVARHQDRGLWHVDVHSLVVVVGHAIIASGLEVPLRPSPSDPPQLAELAESARTLDGPLMVNPRLGIGVVGPRTVAMACARGVLMQLARSLPPSDYWVSVAGSDEDGSAPGDETWLSALPHDRRRMPRDDASVPFVATFGIAGEATPFVTVAVAETEALVPPTCRIVLSCAGEARVVQHPDPEVRVPLRPGFVSRLDAEIWATALREDPRAHAGRGAHGVPSRAELADLLGAPASEGDGLSCRPVVGAHGPVPLDLVLSGPHAVVGGTTGSGKSEFLVSWVVAMAASHSPQSVSFLLVDFKGGSAFVPLATLPHVVGTITDLDEQEAARALASLRAELRFRERALADAGARSIEESTLPRLVIVVDEFAAMLAEFPDLHALFADIAARGRSLGVHLILCTQRPAGVVRDSLLANADLRISLRVNNRADSDAVVGVADAAELDASVRGRAILRGPGGEPHLVQVAITSPDDIGAVRLRWSDSPAPRRPWRDPLPPVIAPTLLRWNGPGTALGIVDLPEEQRQETFVWLPESDGHLLVLGAPRSGRSTALAGVPGATIPRDPAAAWDALARVVERLDSGSPIVGVLVMDDLDVLVPRFGQEHRAAWLDWLARVLREGPAQGLHVAMSAQRLHGDLHPIGALAPARLMMGHASRQDWVLAGGDGALFVSSPPAGWALWQSHRVQVAAFPIASPAAPSAEVSALADGAPLAVATTRATAVVARLRSAGWAVVSPEDAASFTHPIPVGTAVVGDVDDWQARWGFLGTLREQCDVVLEGCGLADVRLLTRSRDLPPPLPTEPGTVWHWRQDGTIGRAVLRTDVRRPR